MSIVTLQIGQCGNQIGHQFYDQIMKEMVNATPASQAVAADTFFTYDKKSKKHTANSLLVDMEPKVINECLSAKKRENLWDYDPKNTFSKQEGSGNNWAFGYNKHGPDCSDTIIDKLKSLTERLDYVDSLVFFQSLAGGTGSGVGSYLLETIRDEFPSTTIMNMAIAPLMTGEVIVQNYNTMLTLQSLYNHSDGILIIENDLLDLICKKLLHLKKPKLEEMNRVLVNMLCSFFYPALPTKNKMYTSYLDNQIKISDLLNQQLVSNPLYKLLTLKNVPQMPDSFKDFTNDQWAGLEKRIIQMLISNSSEADITWQMTQKSPYMNKSIANVMISRGSNVDEYPFEMIQSKSLYTKNMSSSYSLIRDTHRFNNNDKSICILSNSQGFQTALKHISTRGYQMLNTKAYIYQYEKHGTGEEEFQEALATVEQVYRNYEEL